MYPSSSSSSSSSSQKSMSSNSGLIRYGSAPGSFLTNAVDSVIGNHDFTASLGSQAANPHQHHQPPHQRPPPPPSLLGQYFSAADSSSVTSESTCKVNASDRDNAAGGGLQRSFGFSDLTVGGGSTTSCSQLVRQRSSPAGFLSHLAAENAFSLSRGGGSSCNNNNGGQGQGQLGCCGLKSQLSFTRQDSQLSQISEVSESIGDGVVVGHGHGHGHGNNGSHSASFTTSFGIDSSSSWDDLHNTNSIVFSAPPSSKRHRTINNNNISMDGTTGDIYTFHHPLETQFSMPETSLEMAAVERMLHVPDDSIPCKIRAKRGCATHPRSIAERERRTRISGRLKKLQDLVPNMDKQTSYSDMLDLAVQHIRTLQTQVQKLRHDLDKCKCGCKPTS